MRNPARTQGRFVRRYGPRYEYIITYSLGPVRASVPLGGKSAAGSLGVGTQRNAPLVIRDWEEPSPLVSLQADSRPAGASAQPLPPLYLIVADPDPFRPALLGEHDERRHWGIVA